MASYKRIPVVLSRSDRLALGACLEGPSIEHETRPARYIDDILEIVSWYGGLMLFALRPRLTVISRVYIPGLRFDLKRLHYPSKPRVSTDEILDAWALIASGEPESLLMISGQTTYPRGYSWTVSDSGSYRLSPTCR